jgi:methionine salvage enolase-phosphatase E1
MFICQHCLEKKYEKILSLRNHERCCKSNFNRIVSRLSQYNKEHNVKSLFKTSQGKRLSERYKKGELTAHSTPHTEKTKQRLSEVAKERKLGGYVQGSGRGKKGWYKGFFCDSSWELAYVVYCLDHEIDIKRNTEKRQYIWQGVVKNYIPDFIVEGTFTEVKGYKTEQWLAKLEANQDVEVLYEKDLKPILDYIKSKYGKGFTSLYE